MKRCFLVGCPRSGTTLLQAMLAQHSSVFTIPETHYFHKIRGRLARHPKWPVVSPRAAARTLDSLVAATEGAQRPEVPRWWLGVQRYHAAFSATLDGAAEAHGVGLWIEKSPVHLHYIDQINRAIPTARFLHLLRDGRDVVASLVSATDSDPERWIPQLVPRSGSLVRGDLIAAAAFRWNFDLRQSISWLGQPNHLLVMFEDLLEHPEATLRRVCDFLGIPYTAAMLRHWEAADKVLGWRTELPHMQNVRRPLEARRLHGFSNLAEDEKRELIVLLDYAGDPRRAIEARSVQVRRR